MKKSPEKPEKQKDQIDQLWMAVYNHIPSRFRWVDMKLNFILTFLGLVLALIGIVIVLVK